MKRPPSPPVRLALLALLAALLLAPGCRRKSAPAAVAEPPAPPLPAFPETAKLDKEKVSLDLQDLQLAADAYAVARKAKPATLEQVIQAGFLPAMPPAPAGFKYALETASGRVRLVPR